MKAVKYFLMFFVVIALFSCGGREEEPQGDDTEFSGDTGEASNVEVLENKNSVSLRAFQDSNGLWGYTNENGDIVIEPKYRAAMDFLSEGIGAVEDSSGWAYIDSKGNTVITPYVVNNKPDEFSDGLARFSDSGKFGYFDKTGMIVIKPQFDFAEPFSEGMAAVCIGCRFVTSETTGRRTMEGGKWGYIDLNGNMVIKPLYKTAEAFKNGKAAVGVEERIFTINKEGNEVN